MLTILLAEGFNSHVDLLYTEHCIQQLYGI